MVVVLVPYAATATTVPGGPEVGVITKKSVPAVTVRTTVTELVPSLSVTE